jgi:hypothetical protein
MSPESACTFQEFSPAVPYAAKIPRWPVSRYSKREPLAADVTAIPLVTERMPSLDVSPLFKKSPGQATSGTTSMLMDRDS